jgi:TolB protein
MRKVVLALLMLIFVLSDAWSSQGNDDVLLELPGRIAYIGLDHNVYTLSLHDDGLAALSEDGSPARRYQWPTWSLDNELAYFCCNALFMQQIATEIHVSPDGVSAAELIHTAENTVFNYAFWSPGNCAPGEDCRDLAVLLSQLADETLSVELVRSGDQTPTVQTVGTGIPFYYSWSPDGRRMLLQRNGQRLDIYNVETGEITTLPHDAGFFQAPSWSPIDDRLLFGVRSEEGAATDLVIFANEEFRILRASLPGLVSFGWSPDGNYIAYRTVAEGALGSLQILDAETGDTIHETATGGVIAFFWSPDNTHIAFITPATPRGSFNISSGSLRMVSTLSQQTDGLAWSVMEIDSGTVRRYGAFIPTEDMIYLLRYFDQFSQSHRVWSPDSTHVVFSEVTPRGQGAISVLDMTRNDAVPFSIADGLIGIWSYR